MRVPHAPVVVLAAIVAATTWSCGSEHDPTGVDEQRF
jgi:hypothetical protein